MILEQTYGGYYGDSELRESPEYSGDASELVEIASSALTEYHNLSIALARFEHKCITESGDSTYLMEAGVKEFLAGAKATIVKRWKQFVQWLGSMWTRLRDVFVKRADWLNRHKADIAKKTDAELKSLTVKVGNVVAAGSGQYIAAVKNAIGECDNAVKSAASSSPEETTEGFIARIRAKLARAVGGGSAKPDSAQMVMHALVGDKEETVTLTSAIVRGAIAGAEDSFKAIDQMKGAKMIADAAIKVAEGESRMGGDEAKVMAHRIKMINAVSSTVQTTFAQLGSALNTANGQFMSICVKAAGAKAAAAGAAAEPASPVAEGSLLYRFM